MRSGRQGPAVVRPAARRGERRVQRPAACQLVLVAGLPGHSAPAVRWDRRAAAPEACRGASLAATLGALRPDGPLAVGHLRAVRPAVQEVAPAQLTARGSAARRDGRRRVERLRLAGSGRYVTAALRPGVVVAAVVSDAQALSPPAVALAAALGAQVLWPTAAVPAVSDAQALGPWAVVARSDAPAERRRAAAERSGVRAAAVQGAVAAQRAAPGPAEAVLPDVGRGPALAAAVRAGAQRAERVVRLGVGAERRRAAARPAVAAGRQAASAVHPGRLRPAPAPSRAVLTAHAIRSSPFASPTGRSSQAAAVEVWSCDLGSQCDFGQGAR
jgi:hypothetical protein